MVSRVNKLFRVLGLILIVMAFSMVPSAIVALIYGEIDCFNCFITIIFPCAILGIIIYKRLNPSQVKYKAGDGFIIVSWCWIICSLIGALPLVLSGAIPNFIDGFFESASGFSTTGSTILEEIETLPKSILFWRSFTHWLGGMGIIVFVMILFPSMGIGGQLLAGAETPGPTQDKLTAKFSDTAKDLYALYFVFTIAETILLMINGLSLYDALVQTFGTVGTGGFSNYNDSIAHFSSYGVQWTIIIFMVLAGTNFNLYFLLRKNTYKRFFKDVELRFYYGIIIVASLLCTLFLFIRSGDYSEMGRCITDGTFQVVSILTTTGYATDDYTMWPMFAQMIILILMFIGGCSSSTSGGVKVIRILVALKLIKRGVSLKIHPNRISTVTLSNTVLPSEVVQNIASFIFFYIMLFTLGTIVISINGFSLVTSFSAVATSLGNIGPGFGAVGPVCNFAAFSGFSKIILSILMIAGRLELFTFFVLFSKKYWNTNKA